jgi:hypothetical protein
MPINIQTLESNKRLSESLIWDLQKEAMKEDRSSLQDDDRMTTRASFCAVYIDFIVSLLLDYGDRLDRDAPVYILELGAQRGLFSLKVLAGLKQKLLNFERLKDLKIRYLMSDWHKQGFDGCCENVLFKNQIEAGDLDFVLIEDPERAVIHLSVEDRTLSQADFKNPLIVLAKHFFERTRQDAFSVYNHETRLRTYTFFRDSNLFPRNVPVALEQLQFARGEMKPAWTRYDEPHFEDVLGSYKNSFADASIIFPVAALRLLKNLTELTGTNLVVFAADKGHTEMGCFQFDGPAHKYVLHQGRLSFDVNFDAIARYVEALGGDTLVNGGDRIYLATAALFLLKEKPPLEQCQNFWREVIEAKDPLNVTFNIEQLLFKLLTKTSAAAAISDDPERFAIFLSLLRFGDYDPLIFVKAYELLLPKEGVEFLEFDAPHRNDMIIALRRVFANVVYPASSVSALEKLADLFLILGGFDDCIKASELSIAFVGPEPYFYDRLAMAFRGKKEFGKATEMLRECLRLFPDHAWPKEEMERLEKERRQSEALNA